MKHVEILICNRNTWDGIVLTIESIRKRTSYPDYSITVCDNSGGKGDGNRLQYLKYQERLGHIKLIENVITAKMPSGRPKYGHGENIKVLLNQCEAPFGMLLSSGTEISDPMWLNMLVNMIEDEDKDLGIARLRKAENHFQNCWAPFRWIPNWMLLNMGAYAKIASDDLWELTRVPFTEYWHKEMFDGMIPPAHPDPNPLQVFLDTGWALWEKLKYDNPNGLRMLEIPPFFLWRQFKTYDGLDRNSHRKNHPYVKKRLDRIALKLRILREFG